MKKQTLSCCADCGAVFLPIKPGCPNCGTFNSFTLVREGFIIEVEDIYNILCTGVAHD